MLRAGHTRQQRHKGANLYWPQLCYAAESHSGQTYGPKPSSKPFYTLQARSVLISYPFQLRCLRIMLGDSKHRGACNAEHFLYSPHAASLCTGPQM
eukprot:5271685-Amphidinium_carterae.1